MTCQKKQSQKDRTYGLVSIKLYILYRKIICCELYVPVCVFVCRQEIQNMRFAEIKREKYLVQW